MRMDQKRQTIIFAQVVPCTESVYPSEARTHSQNYFEIDKKTHNVPSALDMSIEAATDNFYLKDGRNLADPRFLKCNLSNHLQDR